MTRFWAIFRTTFLQCVRQPIYGILVLVTLAVLLLNLPMAGWTMGTDYHTTDQQFMENLGLATLLTTGLLLAAFAASSVLSKEIENRTALTVAAKPVGRATFVLGKFAGVSAAVALAYYLCTLGFLMLVRHKVMPAASDPYDWPVIVIGTSTVLLSLLLAGVANYLFGWTFIPALIWIMTALMSVGVLLIGFIGPTWAVIPFGEGISPQLLLGVVLVFLSVLTFCVIAVAASTRLGQAMTLLICFAVFLAGSMHPFLFGRWARHVVAVKLFGRILPNLTYADPQDPLTHGNAIPASVMGMTILYFTLYIGGILSLGISLFHGRELDAQSTSADMPGAVGLLAWTGRTLAIVAVGVALVLLSLPPYYTPRGFGKMGGLVVSAVGMWWVWTAFGRGRRWAWWVVLLVTSVGVAAHLTGLALGWPDLRVVGPLPLQIAVAAVLAAVLVVLLLPRTRHHFDSWEAAEAPAAVGVS